MYCQCVIEWVCEGAFWFLTTLDPCQLDQDVSQVHELACWGPFPMRGCRVSLNAGGSGNALVCSGKEGWNAEGLVCRNSQLVIPHSVTCDKVCKQFRTGIKEVMGAHPSEIFD